MSEVKRFDVPSMRSLIQDEQAVMGYEAVLASDYDTLAAEAQALREEVAALRARVVVLPEPLNEGPARRECGEYGAAMQRGYNACLRELARLNGKTVSEWLLRQLLDSDGIDGIFDAQQNYAAHQELRALLNQDKENGNG
ncbi:TPA: hypothetical protein ACGJ0L_004184 [Pseudomonas aeruginosa]|uniref:hypothetical protein n=1 Tax=Pseudomonas aeruginosa TaxID=287 RepID=UPI00053E6365|nr:hypothetical protein [Pseudomonas aeruginosa]